MPTARDCVLPEYRTVAFQVDSEPVREMFAWSGGVLRGLA